MPKTERLYYTDCYLREFEAKVLETTSDPAVAGERVVLDRTAFYPESGGQPSDRGTLGGANVLEVVDEGDVVAHILDRAPAGEIVRGEIDWRRRFDHMQQHTGQHVLSAAFERVAKLKTVSFHLGAESSSIDLDSDRAGERQIDDAEQSANQVVFENRPVRIYFRPVDEARQLDLRKPTERAGDVRLVEIAGFDLSACGGTHVSSTGSIGLILVRKVERLKGKTRVEFLSGHRALEAARRDHQALTEAARQFSASGEQVPALLARQFEELRALNRSRQKILERLAEVRARELYLAALEKNGRRIVRMVLGPEDEVDAKKLAHEIAAQPHAVALVGVKGKPATFYFAQTPGGAADMGALLKQTVARFGGKGGGARDFAQGGGVDEGHLEEALLLAESLL